MRDSGICSLTPHSIYSAFDLTSERELLHTWFVVARVFLLFLSVIVLMVTWGHRHGLSGSFPVGKAAALDIFAESVDHVKSSVGSAWFEQSDGAGFETDDLDIFMEPHEDCVPSYAVLLPDFQVPWAPEPVLGMPVPPIELTT
jgi:hypothetical protein